MTQVVFVDSGPLGEVINPRPKREVVRWIQFLKERKIALRVAEITDYEIRRNCLLEGLNRSIGRLNKFRQTQQFVPIDSEAMLLASEIWAELRKERLPTASPESLDGDVILAAQTISQQEDFDEVIIVTKNPKHFVRLDNWEILTWGWKQALSDCQYNEINIYQA